EPYGGTQRRFRLAHLARRYTQDVAVAADDGDRRRGYRGRNLFARAGRSFEWITGARDKRQRALACRRRPAFAPRGLRSRHAASPASGCFRFGFAVPPTARGWPRRERAALVPPAQRSMAGAHGASGPPAPASMPAPKSPKADAKITAANRRKLGS